MTLNARSILTSQDIVGTLDEHLARHTPAVLLTELHAHAMQAREDSGAYSPQGMRLAEAEKAIVEQLGRLDFAVNHILGLEGRPNLLRDHRRDDDPDLPADPEQLKDPVFLLRYALIRHYRKLFDFSFRHGVDGAWPLVTHDLLDDLDGKRALLIDLLPEAVHEHAGLEFMDRFSLPQIRRAKSVTLHAQSDVGRKLADLELAEQRGFVPLNRGKAAKQILKWLWDKLDDVAKVLTGKEIAELAAEAARAMQEAIEKRRAEEEARRQQEAAKRAWRDAFGKEPKEMNGASDYVDRFERNRDTISRSC